MGRNKEPQGTFEEGEGDRGRGDGGGVEETGGEGDKEREKGR